MRDDVQMLNMTGVLLFAAAITTAAGAAEQKPATKFNWPDWAPTAVQSSGLVPPGNAGGKGAHPVIPGHSRVMGAAPSQRGAVQPGARAPGTGVGHSRPQLTFSHFRVGNRNIKAMLADGPLMWVGTSGGVVRYDTVADEYRVYDVRSGLLSNGIFHLSRIGDQLAVGTYGGGLSMLDLKTKQWRNFNIQHGLGDSFIYDVLEARNGDLWIATWSGANRVRRGQLEDAKAWDLFTVKNTEGGLPNDWVYGLANGANGEVWMATEGGLARYQDGRWSHWGHADGLGAPYEQVRDQIEFTRDPAKESSHHARQKAEQGLGRVDVAYNPNYIVALNVAQDGVVWAGTWGGGLARFDGKTWRNYTRDDGLPANHVFMLRPDGEGGLWIGTSKGLAQFDGTRFKVYTTADGLFADNVFSMAKDQAGTMWIGSFGGVARINGLAKAR